MENETRTPAPEQQPQPVQQPVQSPVQPQPVQQPQYPPYAPQPQYPQQQYAGQPQYRPAYPPYAQPQPAQQQKKTAAWKIVVPIVAGVLVLALLAGVYFLFLRATPVESLRLYEDSITLRPGDVYELYYTCEPADADAFAVSWSSGDPSVATVENGTVTAVGVGKCPVTVTAENGVRAVCHVVVEEVPLNGEIVGMWRFNGAFIDGTAYNADESDAALVVHANQTGTLTIDGKRMTFQWRFLCHEDGIDQYEMRVDDGTVCTILYYGDLTIYGDEENSINFIR
ncbi:MAG: Ig domain-containing protein [Oscillospiraceae bacterium]|nr:Ig domain-containing protein [Oscillospiraceae bacterium]